VHRLGRRRDQRFIAFDCGCFSADFRFNELVNCMEGESPAPAGRHAGTDDRGCRFAGTILLDHLENMPVQAQEQMLQIMDSRNRSQDGADLAMDVRFMVATSLDPRQRVAEGRFSGELFARLNAMELFLPSLRERRDDIVPLCSYFIGEFNREFHKSVESVSEEVFDIFRSYAFPGNVRELRHIVERAVIVSDGSRIEPRHLPERLREATPAAPMPAAMTGGSFPSLNEMEQVHILRALELTQGNRSRAAEILGISRAALWRKIKLLNA
jgi:two-component system response regulator AtoC